MQWLKGLLGFLIGAGIGGVVGYAIAQAQYWVHLKNAPDVFSLLIFGTIGLLIVLGAGLALGIAGAFVAARYL